MSRPQHWLLLVLVVACAASARRAGETAAQMALEPGAVEAPDLYGRDGATGIIDALEARRAAGRGAVLSAATAAESAAQVAEDSAAAMEGAGREGPDAEDVTSVEAFEDELAAARVADATTPAPLADPSLSVGGEGPVHEAAAAPESSLEETDDVAKRAQAALRAADTAAHSAGSSAHEERALARAVRDSDAYAAMLHSALREATRAAHAALVARRVNGDASQVAPTQRALRDVMRRTLEADAAAAAAHRAAVMARHSTTATFQAASATSQAAETLAHAAAQKRVQARDAAAAAIPSTLALETMVHELRRDLDVVWQDAMQALDAIRLVPPAVLARMLNSTVGAEAAAANATGVALGGRRVDERALQGFAGAVEQQLAREEALAAWLLKQRKQAEEDAVYGGVAVADQEPPKDAPDRPQMPGGRSVLESRVSVLNGTVPSASVDAFLRALQHHREAVQAAEAYDAAELVREEAQRVASDARRRLDSAVAGRAPAAHIMELQRASEDAVTHLGEAAAQAAEAAAALDEATATARQSEGVAAALLRLSRDMAVLHAAEVHARELDVLYRASQVTTRREALKATLHATGAGGPADMPDALAAAALESLLNGEGPVLEEVESDPSLLASMPTGAATGIAPEELHESRLYGFPLDTTVPCADKEAAPALRRAASSTLRTGRAAKRARAIAQELYAPLVQYPNVVTDALPARPVRSVVDLRDRIAILAGLPPRALEEPVPPGPPAPPRQMTLLERLKLQLAEAEAQAATQRLTEMKADRNATKLHEQAVDAEEVAIEAVQNVKVAAAEGEAKRTARAEAIQSAEAQRLAREAAAAAAAAATTDGAAAAVAEAAADAAAAQLEQARVEAKEKAGALIDAETEQAVTTAVESESPYEAAAEAAKEVAAADHEAQRAAVAAENAAADAQLALIRANSLAARAEELRREAADAAAAARAAAQRVLREEEKASAAGGDASDVPQLVYDAARDATDRAVKLDRQAAQLETAAMRALDAAHEEAAAAASTAGQAAAVRAASERTASASSGVTEEAQRTAEQFQMHTDAEEASTSVAVLSQAAAASAKISADAEAARVLALEELSRAMQKDEAAREAEAAASKLRRSAAQVAQAASAAWTAVLSSPESSLALSTAQTKDAEANELHRQAAFATDAALALRAEADRMLLASRAAERIATEARVSSRAAASTATAAVASVESEAAREHAAAQSAAAVHAARKAAEAASLHRELAEQSLEAVREREVAVVAAQKQLAVAREASAPSTELATQQAVLEAARADLVRAQTTSEMAVRAASAAAADAERAAAEARRTHSEESQAREEESKTVERAVQEVQSAQAEAAVEQLTIAHVPSKNGAALQEPLEPFVTPGSNLGEEATPGKAQEEGEEEEEEDAQAAPPAEETVDAAEASKPVPDASREAASTAAAAAKALHELGQARHSAAEARAFADAFAEQLEQLSSEAQRLMAQATTLKAQQATDAAVLEAEDAASAVTVQLTAVEKRAAHAEEVAVEAESKVADAEARAEQLREAAREAARESEGQLEALRRSVARAQAAAEARHHHKAALAQAELDAAAARNAANATVVLSQQLAASAAEAEAARFELEAKLRAVATREREAARQEAEADALHELEVQLAAMAKAAEAAAGPVDARTEEASAVVKAVRVAAEEAEAKAAAAAAAERSLRQSLEALLREVESAKALVELAQQQVTEAATALVEKLSANDTHDAATPSAAGAGADNATAVALPPLLDTEALRALQMAQHMAALGEQAQRTQSLASVAAEASASAAQGEGAASGEAAAHRAAAQTLAALAAEVQATLPQAPPATTTTAVAAEEGAAAATAAVAPSPLRDLVLLPLQDAVEEHTKVAQRAAEEEERARSAAEAAEQQLRDTLEDASKLSHDAVHSAEESKEQTLSVVAPEAAAEAAAEAEGSAATAGSDAKDDEEDSGPPPRPPAQDPVSALRQSVEALQRAHASSRTELRFAEQEYASARLAALRVAGELGASQGTVAALEALAAKVKAVSAAVEAAQEALHCDGEEAPATCAVLASTLTAVEAAGPSAVAGARAWEARHAAGLAEAASLAGNATERLRVGHVQGRAALTASADELQRSLEERSDEWAAMGSVQASANVTLLHVRAAAHAMGAALAELEVAQGSLSSQVSKVSAAARESARVQAANATRSAVAEWEAAIVSVRAEHRREREAAAALKRAAQQAAALATKASEERTAAAAALAEAEATAARAQMTLRLETDAVEGGAEDVVAAEDSAIIAADAAMADAQEASLLRSLQAVNEASATVGSTREAALATVKTLLAQSALALDASVAAAEAREREAGRAQLLDSARETEESAKSTIAKAQESGTPEGAIVLLREYERMADEAVKHAEQLVGLAREDRVAKEQELAAKAAATREARAAADLASRAAETAAASLELAAAESEARAAAFHSTSLALDPRVALEDALRAVHDMSGGDAGAEDASQVSSLATRLAELLASPSSPSEEPAPSSSSSSATAFVELTTRAQRRRARARRASRQQATMNEGGSGSAGDEALAAAATEASSAPTTSAIVTASSSVLVLDAHSVVEIVDMARGIARRSVRRSESACDAVKVASAKVARAAREEAAALGALPSFENAARAAQMAREKVCGVAEQAVRLEGALTRAAALPGGPRAIAEEVERVVRSLSRLMDSAAAASAELERARTDLDDAIASAPRGGLQAAAEATASKARQAAEQLRSALSDRATVTEAELGAQEAANAAARRSAELANAEARRAAEDARFSSLTLLADALRAQSAPVIVVVVVQVQVSASREAAARALYDEGQARATMATVMASADKALGELSGAREQLVHTVETAVAATVDAAQAAHLSLQTMRQAQFGAAVAVAEGAVVSQRVAAAAQEAADAAEEAAQEREHAASQLEGATHALKDMAARSATAARKAAAEAAQLRAAGADEATQASADAKATRSATQASADERLAMDITAQAVEARRVATAAREEAERLAATARKEGATAVRAVEGAVEEWRESRVKAEVQAATEESRLEQESARLASEAAAAKAVAKEQASKLEETRDHADEAAQRLAMLQEAADALDEASPTPAEMQAAQEDAARLEASVASLQAGAEVAWSHAQEASRRAADAMRAFSLAHVQHERATQEAAAAQYEVAHAIMDVTSVLMSEEEGQLAMLKDTVERAERLAARLDRVVPEARAEAARAREEADRAEAHAVAAAGDVTGTAAEAEAAQRRAQAAARNALNAERDAQQAEQAAAEARAEAVRARGAYEDAKRALQHTRRAVDDLVPQFRDDAEHPPATTPTTPAVGGEQQGDREGGEEAVEAEEEGGAADASVDEELAPLQSVPSLSAVLKGEEGLERFAAARAAWEAAAQAALKAHRAQLEAAAATHAAHLQARDAERELSTVEAAEAAVTEASGTASAGERLSVLRQEVEQLKADAARADEAAQQAHERFELANAHAEERARAAQAALEAIHAPTSAELLGAAADGHKESDAPASGATADSEAALRASERLAAAAQAARASLQAHVDAMQVEHQAIAAQAHARREQERAERRAHAAAEAEAALERALSQPAAAQEDEASGEGAVGAHASAHDLELLQAEVEHTRHQAEAARKEAQRAADAAVHTTAAAQEAKASALRASAEAAKAQSAQSEASSDQRTAAVLHAGQDAAQLVLKAQEAQDAAVAARARAAEEEGKAVAQRAVADAAVKRAEALRDAVVELQALADAAAAAHGGEAPPSLSTLEPKHLQALADAGVIPQRAAEGAVEAMPTPEAVASLAQEALVAAERAAQAASKGADHVAETAEAEVQRAAEVSRAAAEAKRAAEQSKAHADALAAAAEHAAAQAAARDADLAKHAAALAARAAEAAAAHAERVESEAVKARAAAAEAQRAAKAADARATSAAPDQLEAAQEEADRLRAEAAAAVAAVKTAESASAAAAEAARAEAARAKAEATAARSEARAAALTAAREGSAEVSSLRQRSGILEQIASYKEKELTNSQLAYDEAARRAESLEKISQEAMVKADAEEARLATLRAQQDPPASTSDVTFAVRLAAVVRADAEHALKKAMDGAREAQQARTALDTAHEQWVGARKASDLALQQALDAEASVARQAASKLSEAALRADEAAQSSATAAAIAGGAAREAREQASALGAQASHAESLIAAAATPEERTERAREAREVRAEASASAKRADAREQEARALERAASEARAEAREAREGYFEASGAAALATHTALRNAADLTARTVADTVQQVSVHDAAVFEQQQRIERAQRQAEEAAQRLQAAEAAATQAREELAKVVAQAATQSTSSDGSAGDDEPAEAKAEAEAAAAALRRAAEAEVARAQDARRVALAAEEQARARAEAQAEELRRLHQEDAAVRAAVDAARSSATEARVTLLQQDYTDAERTAARKAEVAANAGATHETAERSAREAEVRASESTRLADDAVREAADAERRAAAAAASGADAVAAEEAAKAAEQLRADALAKLELSRAAQQEAQVLRDTADEAARAARDAHHTAVQQSKAAHEVRLALLRELAALRDEEASQAAAVAAAAARADEEAAMAAASAAAMEKAAREAADGARKALESKPNDAELREASAQAAAAATEAAKVALQKQREAAAVAQEAIAKRAEAAAKANAASAAAHEVSTTEKEGTVSTPPTVHALEALRAAKEASAAQMESARLAKVEAEAAEKARELSTAAAAEAAREAAARRHVAELEARAAELASLAEAAAQGGGATSPEARAATQQVALAASAEEEARAELELRAKAAAAAAAVAASQEAAAARARDAARQAGDRAAELGRRAVEAAQAADDKYLQTLPPGQSESTLSFDQSVKVAERVQKRLANLVQEYEGRMERMRVAAKQLRETTSRALTDAMAASGTGGPSSAQAVGLSAFARQVAAATDDELSEARDAWTAVQGLTDQLATTVTSLRRMLKDYALSPAFRKRSGMLMIHKIEVAATAPAGRGEWTEVRFPEPFVVPPVVLVTTTMEDSQPATLRVARVTREGFAIAPVHAHGQAPHHGQQIVHYLAATPGRHALPDGTLLEVGLAEVSATQISPDCGAALARDSSWHQLVFAAPFPGSPSLLLQIQGSANEENDVPRAVASTFLTVAVGHVGPAGARIALERGQSKAGAVVKPERVGFVAIMPRAGLFMDSEWHPIHYESFISQPQVRGISRGNFYVGSRTFVGNDPAVFAHTASRNNARGGWVRVQSAKAYHHYFRLDNTQQCGTRDLPEEERLSVLLVSETGAYPLFEPLDMDLESEAARTDSLVVPTPEEAARHRVATARLEPVMMEVGLAQFRHTGLDPRFSIIRFQQEYEEPPLVFFLMDRMDEQPADVRIREVTTKHVVAAIVEPPKFDGVHRHEEIPYLVIERGVHRMPDGSLVEAGELWTNATQYDRDCVQHGEDKRWHRLAFNTSFAATPAMLARIQTMNNERAGPPSTVSTPFLSAATRGVGPHGADIALERSRVKEGGLVLTDERVAYVAFERGLGNFADARGRAIKFEIDVTPPLVRGSGMGCQHIGMRQLYQARDNPPPVVLAHKVTHNSEEGGFVRWCGHDRWTQHWSVRLLVDKDTSCSPDREHTYERAALAVFSHPFILRRSPLPEPAEDKSPLPPSSPPRMEAGFAIMRDTFRSRDITRVWFDKPFKQPPLVFLMPGTPVWDWNPVAIRITKVSYEYFEATLASPAGARVQNRAQAAPYLAVEPGVYRLPDGSVLEAGLVQTRAQQLATLCFNNSFADASLASWHDVRFNHTFESAPAVLTQIQGMVNEHKSPPATPSMPYLNAVTRNAAAGGMQLALERGHQGLMGHVDRDEAVAYLAMSPRVGSFAADDGSLVRYESRVEAQAVRGNLHWGGATCSLLPITTQYSRVPVAFASLASRNADDGGWLRICRNGLHPRRLQVAIDQDVMCQHSHWRRPHDPEDVSFMLFSHPFTRVLYLLEDDPLAEAARLAMAKKQAEQRALLAQHAIDVAAHAADLAALAHAHHVVAEDDALLRTALVREEEARLAREASMAAQHDADYVAGLVLKAGSEERRSKERAEELQAAALALRQRAQAVAEQMGADSANAVAIDRQAAHHELAAKRAVEAADHAVHHRRELQVAADDARLHADELFVNATRAVMAARDARAAAEAGFGSAAAAAANVGPQRDLVPRFDVKEPGLQPLLGVMAQLREALNDHVSVGQRELGSAQALVEYLRARFEAEESPSSSSSASGSASAAATGDSPTDAAAVAAPAVAAPAVAGAGGVALLGPLHAGVVEAMLGALEDEGREGATPEAWGRVYASLERLRATVQHLRTLGRGYEASPFFRTITGTLMVEMVEIRDTKLTRDWTYIRFPRPFESVPVVILTPEMYDSQTMTLRVRDVTRDGFRVAPVRSHPHPPHHGRQIVHYLAATPGRHALPDGTLVEVGVAEVSATQISPDCGSSLVAGSSWHNLIFRRPFAGSPSLLLQIQGSANEANDVPRAVASTFLTVAVAHVGSEGARIALERGQSKAGAVVKPERVGYFAIAQRARMFLDRDQHPISFESFISFPQVASMNRGNFYVGSRTFLGNTPVVFAHTASRNNARGGWVRRSSASRWHHYFRLDNTQECGPRDLPQLERLSVFLITETGDYTLFHPLDGDSISADAAIDTLDTEPYAPPVPSALAVAAGLPPTEVGTRGANLEVGWARFDNTHLETRWTTIRFQQEYAEPPLVFFLVDRMDGEPADVRIKEVTTKHVVAAIVEPPKYDGAHRHEEFAYLAVQRGVQRLPDGSLVEAGELETNATQYDRDCVQHGEAQRWDTVSFKAPFAGAPALITRVQTMRNEQGDVPRHPSTPFLTVATRDLNRYRTSIALERSRVKEGGSHVRAERVAFVAFERGIGNFVDAHRRSVAFEFDITPAILRGLNMGCQHVGLRRPMPGAGDRARPLILADKVTHNSPEGGFMRLCAWDRWNQHWSVQLMIDKDTSCSPDRSHTYERAAIVVFSQPFALRTGSPPAQAQNYVQQQVGGRGGGASDPQGRAHMEAGWAHIADTWKSRERTRIWFRKPFPRPPLVFMLPQQDPHHPVSVRVFEVHHDFFVAALIAPPGVSLPHFGQVVPYVAISEGVHDVPGLGRVDARLVSTASQQFNRFFYRAHTSWSHLSFRTTFRSPPAVLAQLQVPLNEHGNPPATSSLPFLTPAVQGVSRSSMQYALERTGSGAIGRVARPEPFAYLAIEPATGEFKASTIAADGGGHGDSSATILFQALHRPAVLNTGCSNVGFSRAFPRTPVVVASLSSRSDQQGGWAATCGSGATRNHVGLHVHTDGYSGHWRYMVHLNLGKKHALQNELYHIQHWRIHSAHSALHHAEQVVINAQAAVHTAQSRVQAAQIEVQEAQRGVADAKVALEEARRVVREAANNPTNDASTLPDVPALERRLQQAEAAVPRAHERLSAAEQAVQAAQQNVRKASDEASRKRNDVNYLTSRVSHLISTIDFLDYVLPTQSQSVSVLAFSHPFVLPL